MLKFKYCECGCKCYTASKKGISYSIFWDLSKSKKAYRLDKGYLNTIGKYPTYTAAIKAAEQDYKNIK